VYRATALSAAATPRLACEALAAAINAGDLEAALACFSPGACLIAAEGSTATGEAAIRPRLWELIANGARIEIELAGVIVAEEVALAHERWRISYPGRRASRSPQSALPSLVLCCLEGEWKLAIAAPWGMPATAPLRAIWP
jgi:ketosteroid isomerase-like protein